MSKILKNASFLMVIQLSGYIIPLVELPFLARVLSPSVLGQILFIQAIALTSSFFVEYGFNLRASRQFAQSINNRAEKSELIGLVFQAKIILLTLVLLVLFFFYTTVDLFSEKIPIDYIFPLFFSIVGFGFSSFWYFQATEKMGLAAYWELQCRILYLSSILVWVKSDEDALLVLYCQSIFILLSTLGEFVLLSYREHYTFSSWRLAWREIKQGWHVFLYKSSSSIVMSMSIGVLGMVSSTAAVSYYAGADKIVRAMVGLAQPLVLASYPRFSQLSISNQKLGYELVAKYAIATSILLIPSLTILFFLAPYIIEFFLGSAFKSAVAVFSILIIIIPLRILNTILGYLGLLASQKDKLIANITLVASILALLFGAVLGNLYAQIGMAIAMIIAESYIFACYVRAFTRQRKLL